MVATDTAHAKVGKARFDHIYNQPDPRPYYQTLERLDYQIPAHGQRMFGLLADRLRHETGRSDLVVLDLCCSYGVNAALLNHELTLETLYGRYHSAELASLTSDELAKADASFFVSCRRQSSTRMVGLDTAERAVGYAVKAALLGVGSDENLERAEPGEALGRHLAAVDLITVTGGIGYISERTFDRVLRRASLRGGPWVACFALRWVDFRPIDAVLARHGLVTEKLASHTFPQRRFADDGERTYVLGELERMGIDPTDKETEGYYHAEFYLSRPALHAEAVPLRELTATVG
jgi:hypothetical protein